MDLPSDSQHPIASIIVTLTGVAYFSLWSYSFYPQVILNYRRKTGFSPDFSYVNPTGFLALSIWNWTIFFSPLARQQYATRHNGHLPQVSPWDIAFSTHALFLSLIVLLQVLWYARKHRLGLETNDETSHLLPVPEQSPKIKSEASWTKPSIIARTAIILIFVSAFLTGCMVWIGKLEFLDWLYWISTIKLIISTLKYIPQVILNWKVKSVEGFAIGAIICNEA
ncbi:hypothetical protein TREMEDRAFT_61281 [Tremella mesenterica DSM 1558]|uniref:uncharacterized protein n=1 Tax=Tremella mesenterica (strain ATCC 24925 / CBS 8224 / DSM 1558 / NBRC 9311 / NRRL Y-6157 / RJB 2259-6 / UBC 559-6) TaxID=578456 RepID=UPI0003F491C7|nr:uncharacterized protein TREMEDRAFT_61281 [Tremella mesenterica DSM 1558]EIW70774.1 hypothetical protein TREMEDRAFT_61281 [Tremella mesenterica DSM 1558]